jgi:hypothetical protein
MSLLSLRRTAALATALLTLTGIAALAAIAPSPASANIIVGFEANGELANPERTPEEQSAALDKVQAAGATLIRINVSWKNVAENCVGQTLPALTDNTNPCYKWSVYDSLISQANQRGIQVLVSVTQPPSWLQPAKPSSYTADQRAAYLGTTSAQWLRTIQFYPAFMSAIATRYDVTSELGTVKLWTIWSEPNSNTFWTPQATTGPAATALRYAQLYVASAKAIKAANPAATVAPGPTGPNSTNKPVPFIKAFQKAVTPRLPGATISAKRRYLGAWAHNPYPVSYSPSLGSAKLKGHAYLSPDALGMPDVPALVTLLDSAPITRGLKVWATEFGWQTNTADMGNSVSYANQAKWIPEAFDWLDRTNRVTIGVSYVLTDPIAVGDFQSGVYNNAGAPKASFYAFQRMISTDITTARRGGYVNIWAKANVNPKKTAIQYSANGFSGWRTLPAPRRADGSVRKRLRLIKTLCFRTSDGTTTFGPKRCVLVKK